MVTSHDLLEEIAGLEREIDALRDHRRELELGLRYARGGAYPLRRFFLVMLRRDLERRIYRLRLKYGVAYNGYLLLRREETGDVTTTPPLPRRSPRASVLRRGGRRT